MHLHFLFWIFVVILAFLPGGIYMSFVLLILYYGGPILKNILKEGLDGLEIRSEKITFTISESEDSENFENMDSYSDDTMEEMK